MDCPRCSGELGETTYEDFPVYRCAKCRGFWVSGEILRGIIEKRHEKMPQEALEVAKNWHSSQMPKKELPDELKCPRCGEMLSRGVYGVDTGIIIDRCPTGCGVWLDAGELVELQAFDEVWDEKARQIFKEKGLQRIFEVKKTEDPETEVIRRGLLGRSIIGRLADLLVDFLD